MWRSARVSTSCISRLVCRIESNRRCHNSLKYYDSLPWYKKLWEKYKLFTYAESSTAFDPVLLRSVYKADRLDRSKWSIIYYDFTASRIGGVGSMVIASIVVATGVAAVDYYMHGEFTLQYISVLKDDADELGVYICIPATLFVFVTSLLLRLHFMRVYRIYQNMEKPLEYTMVSAGKVKLYNQKTFKRAEVKVRDQFYGEMSYSELLRFGTVSIANRSVALDGALFRSQPLKAYMLGENDRVPADLNVSPERTQRCPVEPSLAKKKPPAPPPF